MTNDISKEVISLKIFRDFFEAFDHVIVIVSTFKEKYGMELRDVLEKGLVGPDTLKNLSKTLTVEQLGTLFQAIVEVSGITDDISKFTSYDTEQLKEFHRKLTSFLNKLNNVVR